MKKKTVNSMKISFPSYSCNEATSRGITASFVAQLNPTLEELADIKCAVSEAVTNCIVHGYKGTIGIVSMDIKIMENREIRIEIKDKGCGIEDVPLAMQPLFTTDPESERSGMGFSVMESFMDTLKVSSKPGKGTKVTMAKKLTPLSNIGF